MKLNLLVILILISILPAYSWPWEVETSTNSASINSNSTPKSSTNSPTKSPVKSSTKSKTKSTTKSPTKSSSKSSSKSPSKSSSTSNASNMSSIANVKSTLIRPVNASTTFVDHPYDKTFYRKIEHHIHHFSNLTKLIFLGDSLLHHAARNTTVWEPLELKYGAVSLAGIGDRTENILTRLSKGYLRKITSNPLLVVLCGESNAVVGDTPDDIVRGISAIVDLVRSDLPKSDVVVLSMIPNAKIDLKIPSKNAIYSAVNQNLTSKYYHCADKRIKYVDISGLFLGKNTTKSSLYSSDGIHPNSQGYELIMKKLLPFFDKLPELHLTKDRFKDLKPKRARNSTSHSTSPFPSEIFATSPSKGKHKAKSSKSKSKSKDDSKSKAKSSKSKSKSSSKKKDT